MTRGMQFISGNPSGVPTLAAAASVPQALSAQQDLLPGASVLAPRPLHHPSPPLTRQGRQQHEVVFHQRLCLLGRFSLVVSSTSTHSATSGKAYAAHVFDKGTLLTPFCPDATGKHRRGELTQGALRLLDKDRAESLARRDRAQAKAADAGKPSYAAVAAGAASGLGLARLRRVGWAMS